MQKILILLLTLTILSTSASALTITPETYTTYVDGYELLEITIYNPSNHTVNITLSTNSSKILFYETFFSIPAISSKTTSVVIIKDTPFSDKIWVNNQSINISVVEPEVETITVIPSHPQAGKNIILSFSQENTSGYILCDETNNVYLFHMKDGLALVTLNEEEYGNATVIIKGHTRHFIIQSKYKGNLYIECSPIVQSGEKQNIQVFSGGDPVRAEVTIKKPSGEIYNRTTNMEGKTTIVTDEVGTWQVTAKVFDGITTTCFNVTPKPLSLVLPEHIIVGEETTIQTQSNAKVTIQKDEMTWTYTADTEGKVYFNPPFSGRYTVTATTGTQQGTAFFNAKTKTDIIIKNENDEIVTKAQPGTPLLIQVADNEGKPISTSDSIEIKSNGIPIKTISLSGGSAIWIPKYSANTYTFTFTPSDSTLLLPSEKTIAGVVPVEQTPDLSILLYILPVLLIVLLLLILYKKQKLPSFKLPRFKRQKLPDDLL